MYTFQANKFPYQTSLHGKRKWVKHNGEKKTRRHAVQSVR